MRILYQRLKELSKDDFESLIDQILQARYPAAAITRVNGAGGDLGVDSYQGRLGKELAVWQDKHFPDGLGVVQRKQVLKSIEVAFRKNKPTKWVLCLPIDLNPTERKWFDEKISDVYGAKAEIDLMQASHIVFLLNNHYRNIRDAFFSGALMDAERLKQLVMNVEFLEPADKAALGSEYLGQYTASLQRKDERFRYEVTVGGSARTQSAPGLLASIFDGTKRTDLFVADVAALRDDPIKMIVRLSREAATKFDEARKTGRGFSLRENEVRGLDLPAPLKSLVGNVIFNSLTLVPQIPKDSRLIPTRISCGPTDSAIVYDYLPMKVKYLGSEEVTLVSESNLPFELTIKARMMGEKLCETTIESRYTGRDLASVRKAYEFASAMFAGNEIEIFNLELQSPLLKLTNHHEPAITEQQKGIGALIRDCELVADYLGANIPYPSSEPTEEDYGLLETIKLLKSGTDFEINKIEFLLIKDSNLHPAYKRLLTEGDGGQLYFEASRDKLVRVLFGMPINLGRMLLSVDRVKVRDAAKTLKRFQGAGEGEVVSVVVEGPTNGRYVDFFPPLGTPPT